MTIIGFVRHGVTAWNKEGRAQGSTDVPLDEEGIEMAKRVADRLANEKWDIIYTSHLKRASKTAEIIAEKMPSVELVEDPRLREVSGGMVEGTTEAERIEKWGVDWRQLDMGFETQEAIISRGLESIDEIRRKHLGKRVLVVSHGSFIKRMLNELITDPVYETSLDNTSLTIVELTDDKNVCQLFNCTAHLSLETFHKKNSL
ncbi:histidine phosphatase family protein [Sporosarcina thermotolerans]|uniref:Histidine phosphatase family protein n=1 Tax=Sporosarcina thermotolerans TaxID=633404 RepID=A0AAW9A8Q6_9BACL|nr:histidine phosphatase family protein [Sporosarcina thermotolerans]MDW0116031.1 histidine phosphatase family protein [Sporosarcina thermotolerans]WHT49787.1 histidine phosphatase family protein [Sporosarcina thermotolerans]